MLNLQQNKQEIIKRDIYVKLLSLVWFPVTVLIGIDTLLTLGFPTFATSALNIKTLSKETKVLLFEIEGVFKPPSPLPLLAYD